MKKNDKDRRTITEEILIARMEERFREGDASEELAQFFELQGEESDIPAFMRGSRKKKAVQVRQSEARATEDLNRSPLCPPPTNRGATFHEDAEGEEYPKRLGGYDGGVMIGFEGDWDNPGKKAITFDALETAKQRVQDEDSPDGVFELDGLLYRMMPKSANVGEEDHGCVYKYVFEGDGVKYYVHSNPQGGIQPVRIRYNAEGLIGRDLFHKHYETTKKLKKMGFTIREEKLSRVDMQVMIFCNVEEIIDTSSRDRIVCTARKGSIDFNGLKNGYQTFTLGSTRFSQICVYDKAAEMDLMRQKNPIKYQLMIQECFGEEWEYEQTPTTRVEFRLGRELLKSMKINTMEDLLECEKALAKYCCHRWFRVLEEDKQDGHAHEQQVSARWKEVQEAFEKWFPGVEGHNRDVKRSYGGEIATSSDQLDCQAAGCIIHSRRPIGSAISFVI